MPEASSQRKHFSRYSLPQYDHIRKYGESTKRESSLHSSPKSTISLPRMTRRKALSNIEHMWIGIAERVRKSSISPCHHESSRQSYRTSRRLFQTARREISESSSRNPSVMMSSLHGLSLLSSGSTTLTMSSTSSTTIWERRVCGVSSLFARRTVSSTL